jgi:serine/threonine-protein kinase
VHYLLGWAYIQLGRSDEAVAEAQRAIELAGNTAQRQAALGCALAAAGRTSEAKAILAEVKDRATNEYVSAADVAILHAALGQHDDACEWLHRAVDQRAGWLGYLNVDPIWDPIRQDPRFDAVLRQVGLR